MTVTVTPTWQPSSFLETTEEIYSKRINTFDLDGVIYLPQPYRGIKPEINDIIVTGRSFEEADETYEFLRSRGIYNEVRFNPLPFDEKTRESSAMHKVREIWALQASGYEVLIHWEDDPVQADIIRAYMGDRVQVIRIEHSGLINYENVRRLH